MSVRKAFRVRRVAADVAVCGLPILQSYAPPSQPIDVLVLAAGFEARVAAVPRQLLADDAKPSTILLIGRYGTNVEDNQARLDELTPLLLALCPNKVEFDAEDPIAIGRALDAALSSVPDDRVPHVAFDVSGASSTLIISVIAVLAAATKSCALTIFYTTAAAYYGAAEGGTRNADAPIEQGVGSVSHNVLCAGLHHDHLPATVIALPSMYTDRLESCLSHLNVGPMTGSQDNLFWVLPSTEAEEHKWRQEHVRTAVEALVQRHQGVVDGEASGSFLPSEQVETCDVLNYQRCVEIVVSIVDRFPGRNISIVHMGTKLQAIGVALAVAARCEAAVVSARPKAFNAALYSQGVGETYQLAFPNLRASVDVIARIGTLEVEA